MTTLFASLSVMDPVRWGALALGLLFLVGIVSPDTLDALGGLLRLDGTRLKERSYLWLLSFLAAGLSLGYTAYYLKGGPRSIDATSYFLQARALSDGQFSWEVPPPSGSFRGRFLLEGPENRMGGLFPPGYPLLLSFGFILGAPLIVGPLLAGAIAIVTYLLTKALARSMDLAPATAVSVARAAGLLSVFSAALRYHTADTMSHGAAALGIGLTLLCLLTALREKNGAFYVLAGLAAGYVAATRPVSSIGPLVLGAFFALSGAHGKGGLARFLLGAAPGVAFLCASQASVTGHALQSTQMAYYAASDGPPGCFRLGIDASIGCKLEHGDFLQKYMPQGFTFGAACLATLRRLALHLGDVTNSEPLTFILLGAGFRMVRSSRAMLLAGGLVAVQLVAYFPFYFDGNYPAAGGRLLSDVLPVEHALGLVGLSQFFTNVPLLTRAYLALGVSLLSFAGYAFLPHRAFGDDLGGRPMFEPTLLHEAAVVKGLLFLDSDHGFNLAYGPGVDPKFDVLAVRLRNDDRDRLVYDLFSHPASRRYVFDRKGVDLPRIEHFVPASPHGAWRFETENEWPPFSQTNAFVRRAPHPPASGGEWLLAEVPGNTGTGIVEMDLPVLPSHVFTVKPQVGLLGKGGKATMTVVDDQSGAAIADWSWSDEGPEGGLRALESRLVHTTGPRARVVLRMEKGPVALDAFFVDDDRALP